MLSFHLYPYWFLHSLKYYITKLKQDILTISGDAGTPDDRGTTGYAGYIWRPCPKNPGIIQQYRKWSIQPDTYCLEACIWIYFGKSTFYPEYFAIKDWGIKLFMAYTILLLRVLWTYIGGSTYVILSCTCSRSDIYVYICISHRTHTYLTPYIPIPSITSNKTKNSGQGRELTSPTSRPHPEPPWVFQQFADLRSLPSQPWSYCKIVRDPIFAYPHAPWSAACNFHTSSGKHPKRNSPLYRNKGGRAGIYIYWSCKFGKHQ